MATEYLDVIDTAVKIGMGAAISGVSTYYLTRLNHSKELARQFQTRRLDIIDKTATHVDEYIRGFADLLAAIDGFHKNYPSQRTLDMSKPEIKAAWEFILKTDSAFCDIRDHGLFADSKLQLLGITNVVTLLAELRSRSNEIRNKIVFKREFFDPKELSGWQDSIKAIRNSIFEELGQNYRLSERGDR